MKKFVALLLTLSLLLTGAAALAEGEAKWDGPVEQVVMTLFTAGTDNPYAEDIEKAVNAYIRDKIGVEIKFKQVSIFEAPSAYTRWIAAGEPVDLISIAFTPMTPFIDMNMIQPLDDYLQYGPHICAKAEAGAPLYATNNTENVYGISYLDPGSSAVAYGLWVFEDALKAAGLDYQDGQVVTLEDIDKIAKGVCAAVPDSYVGLYGATPRGEMMTVIDPLGATTTSGALLSLDSDKVVDFFESDIYKQYIRMVRGWYLDGIVKKDAATEDITNAGSMTNDPDHCVMTFNAASLGLKKSYESQTGKKIVALYTSVKYLPAMFNVGSFAAIPVTSQHPEAAMRFLDMMYYDEFVMNTVYSGVEGLTYEFTGDDRKAIAITAEKKFNSLGGMGDGNLLWQYGEYDEEMINTQNQWIAEAQSNHTLGYGFSYDQSAMVNQITALDAVLNEYRGALETGSADIDTIYPEFINKLKMNGIDAVIADKQAQFDAWRAKQ